MASTDNYSHDAISSVVLKSAMLADAPSISSTSSHDDSASKQLVEGLEEAMTMIGDILKSSSDTMEKFRSEWDEGKH